MRALFRTALALLVVAASGCGQQLAAVEQLGQSSRASKLREWRERHAAGYPADESEPQCQQGEPLVYEAAEFVPSPACARARRTTRRTAEENGDRCIAELLADVARLQKNNCTRAMSAELMPGGFGSVIHLMALQLQRAKKLARPLVFTGLSGYSACENQSLACLWCDGSDCPLKSLATCGGQEGGEAFEDVMRAEHTHASHEAWAPDDKFGLCFAGSNALFRYVSALVGWLFSPNALLVPVATASAYEFQ
jgi:hypothetical protein